MEEQPIESDFDKITVKDVIELAEISICLKRHTIKELAGGILVNIIAFIFSVIIVTTF